MNFEGCSIIFLLFKKRYKDADYQSKIETNNEKDVVLTKEQEKERIIALLTIFGAYSWWGDVIREAEHEGHHKPIVQLGLRYGMFLFIMSEVMFFVAWFWAFFDASIFPKEAINYVWPPEGIETLDPWHLPFVNTLILLLSGCTVTWAHHSLIEGDRGMFKQML